MSVLQLLYPARALLLTPQQLQTELVDKYTCRQPGPDLKPLSKYLWRRIFTLNIDDVIETLFRRKRPAQRLVPVNFNDAFVPDTNLSELQCIHLHGFVREPATGFVFSHAEYARVMQVNNPWMLLLSEVLPSESFIIAGASLDEVDLEYYLARRTSSTPRRGRGPSLLVEPNPDTATIADCQKYDVTLVKAEIGEFLQWLGQTFPKAPSAVELVVPSSDSIFQTTIPPRSKLRFFNDFELVNASTSATTTGATPTPFMYGAEPTWEDIGAHSDVERSANQIAVDWLTAWLEQPTERGRLLLFSQEAATGKSTLLKRVGYDLASLGIIVFGVRTLSRIDVDTAASCLRRLVSPCVVLVDNFADHAEQILDLLDITRTTNKVIVLGVERDYRQEHIDIVFSDIPVTIEHLDVPTDVELDQLLENYQRSGLIGDAGLARNRQEAIGKLRGEPIAVSVCRILSDFRPLDRIVASLWLAASESQRRVFVACALAHRCHGAGVRYSILQTIAGSDFSVEDLVGGGCPLPVTTNADNSDFLLPRSTVIAERVLTTASREDRDLMIKTFVDLAKTIAPRVNRNAIRKRTPEARLAGRLLDGDKVVRPLLRAQAEAFYVAVKDSWAWNSRYWEQRALLIADRDIQTALQYARHAVAIETHSHALTTLGKVLLKSLGTYAGGARERRDVFGEAFDVLRQAIDRERHNARVTIHPFATLLTGTARFLEDGGELALEQHDAIQGYAADARVRYGGDRGIADAVGRLDSLM